MGIVTYSDFHFVCDACGLFTHGLSVYGSHGSGWKKRHEAVRAQKQHEKECSTYQLLLKAEEAEQADSQ